MKLTTSLCTVNQAAKLYTSYCVCFLCVFYILRALLLLYGLRYVKLLLNEYEWMSTQKLAS